MCDVLSRGKIPRAFYRHCTLAREVHGLQAANWPVPSVIEFPRSRTTGPGQAGPGRVPALVDHAIGRQNRGIAGPPRKTHETHETAGKSGEGNMKATKYEAKTGETKG